MEKSFCSDPDIPGSPVVYSSSFLVPKLTKCRFHPQNFFKKAFKFKNFVFHFESQKTGNWAVTALKRAAERREVCPFFCLLVQREAPRAGRSESAEVNLSRRTPSPARSQPAALRLVVGNTTAAERC